METRKQEYKKIILLGFNTCKSFNCKALRTNIFEGAYYDMTPRGAYMGLNVHVMCKCICNRVVLIINGPHVQCVNMYI
jgi:hypothetical protein